MLLKLFLKAPLLCVGVLVAWIFTNTIVSRLSEYINMDQLFNMEQGNLEEARAAYLKALEVDPNYVNAQLNLSTSYVNEGNSLIDEMNTLGTSRADTQRYDELKQKKDYLFLEGAKILEEALLKNPDNEGILAQLKNIYGALGDNENFMRIKKLIGE